MESRVFDRIEKKYLITSELKKELLSVIREHMEESGYYKSEVYNLYFDTDNYDFITDSIDWTVFKYKLRARSYAGYDRVFLEIKTKRRGLEDNPGNKRRVMITRRDFKKLLSGVKLEELIFASSKTSHDLQIAREIDYLISRFNLRPRILVMYHRESYRGDDNLRITFDESLRYRDVDLDFRKKKHDKMYFKDGKMIMEIKSQGALPLWLVHCLSKNKVFPERFSKIGKVYENIIKEENV